MKSHTQCIKEIIKSRALCLNQLRVVWKSGGQGSFSPAYQAWLSALPSPGCWDLVELRVRTPASLPKRFCWRPWGLEQTTMFPN